MTIHSKRDIRAADVFAAVLTGFGVLLGIVAVLDLAGVMGRRGRAPLALGIAAGVFLVLGLVLNLKVRQLIRNGGVERNDDGGPD